MNETSEAAVPEEEAAVQEAAPPKKGRKAAPEKTAAESGKEAASAVPEQGAAAADAGGNAAQAGRAAEDFYEQETARIVRERLRAEAAASRSAGSLADSPACPLPESEAFAGAFRRQVY